MKKVTLYQVDTINNRDAFSQNMMAGYGFGTFTNVGDMDAVVMLRMNGTDEAILEDMFCRMNDPEYSYSLNYSMSVGDIVQIDKVYYRCMPRGWERL